MIRFKGRALYNFLQISKKEDPSVKVESWQALDYRSLSVKEILNQMQKLGVVLTEESFLLYAENCDTPEDLLECLWVDEEDEVGQDKLYLLVFELWRKLLPEKQSLSVFCDELDYRISLYDNGLFESNEDLFKSFEELEDILDQSVDQGAKPQEIFQSVISYMAHDVEQFLYDYILDLMDESNEICASELIDGISPYVADRKWFDFLKARLFSMSNSPEADLFIVRLLEQLEEEPDLIFLTEICHFLVHRGDNALFAQCMRQMLPLMKQEADFLEALQLIADFYRALDEEAVAQKIDLCIEKRPEKPEDFPITPSDKKIIETFLV